MDSNYAVRVEHATVRFNRASQKVDNLKEYFIKLIRKELMYQEFLALQDINLEIRKGESWGILGRNGSGKSTLLKLICGILAPYKGKVTTYGSIAPLIELSAGFDGNLTAEENIFLNGALLGYSRDYMQRNYNEIVEFAELHQFLDMPIKNYSSGMRARLGFSVATTVRPDILVVDEVLSVGDISFQKKCEQRMDEMLAGGTTLLFVSHSIDQVSRLCKKAVMLENGLQVATGNVDEVIQAYMKNTK